jgi:N-methylhydantoinase B
VATVEHAPVQVLAPDPAFWDGVLHSYIPGSELRLDGSLALHRDLAETVDPITHEVIRYALLHANLEHSALIQRLCVSPITMLTRDFQTSLLTEDGDVAFLGPNLQYFSNSHALTAKWTLEHRSDNPGIGPGDLFLSNDPFVGAPHQPDTCLLGPLFVDGRLFCWIANTLHYSDVGGSMPGSFCIDAQDTWAEPMSWPPVKLVESGRVRREIEELFARQSRLPHALLMDLRAARAALTATQQRVDAIVARYGADVVKAVIRRTLDAGESLFAQRLEQIPDGTWTHRAYTEAAVPGDRGIYAYQVNITKADGRLLVDNRGTDPQAGAINVTYAAFAGAVLAAITQQMTPDLSGAYGGVYRRVDIRPEPGLLNCADHPAAVSPSGAFTTEMQINAAGIAVAKMLACARGDVRDLALGPCIPHFYSNLAGGADASGMPFIFPNTDGMIGSLGGTASRDGVDSGGHYWIPDGIANNCEDVEATYPLMVLSRRLLPAGADGAGRHRGGRGFVETTMTRNALVCQVVLHTNEAFTKGQGVLGGNPGSRASFRVRRHTGAATRFAAGELPVALDDFSGDDEAVVFKGAPVTIGAEDVWEWTSPTTGGYGDPLRRDPALVLAELDPATAERVYGVIVRDGGVDDAATAEHRRALLAERLGGQAPAAEVEPPADAQRVGDLLHIVDGRWWCNGTDLGPITESYRPAALLRETPLRLIAPEFEAQDVEIADQMVLREYLCPVTGFRIDAEIARGGEPLLSDMRLEA